MSELWENFLHNAEMVETVSDVEMTEGDALQRANDRAELAKTFLTFTSRSAILGGEVGARLRTQFRMDRRDFSDKRVEIQFPLNVTAVDQEFVETFILPTARRAHAGMLSIAENMYGPYEFSLPAEATDAQRQAFGSRILHRMSRVLQNHLYGADPESMARTMREGGHIGPATFKPKP
jgi:hypothetical protein